MLRTRTAVVAAATLLGSTLLAAPAQGSDEPAFTASLDPTAASTWAKVTISGTGCLRDRAPGRVSWSVGRTVDDVTYGVSYTPSGGNQARPDGSWSWTFTVPENLGSPTEPWHFLVVLPGDQLDVKAVCYALGESPEGSLEAPS